MNSVYMLIDEKREYALVKIGFASCIKNRMITYATSNPEAMCVDYVHTQSRSKHYVEKQFHKEILEKGYMFIRSNIFGSKTEWFKIGYDDPFYMELKLKGLNAFNCGKNRKTYGRFKIEA